MGVKSDFASKAKKKLKSKLSGKTVKKYVSDDLYNTIALKFKAKIMASMPSGAPSAQQAKVVEDCLNSYKLSNEAIATSIDKVCEALIDSCAEALEEIVQRINHEYDKPQHMAGKEKKPVIYE